jgi:uncharacterized protein (DUF433 family)
MATQTLDELIAIVPGVNGPQPRIAGRGIKVKYLAVWHKDRGMSAEEIADQYDLSLAQVHAALAYYYIHQEEIDAELRADDEFAEELRQRTPSVVPPAVRDAWYAARRKNGS